MWPVSRWGAARRKGRVVEAHARRGTKGEAREGEKKKSRSRLTSPRPSKELTPSPSPIFHHTCGVFHQLALHQGPSARRRLAVSAGRRAREWRARHALAGMGSWGGGSSPGNPRPRPRGDSASCAAGRGSPVPHTARVGARPHRRGVSNTPAQRAVRPECGVWGWAGGGGSRAAGTRKKKRKSPKQKGAVPPPFFFSTRASFFTSWRRLQGPSARRGMPLSWRGAGRVRDVLGLARPVRASEHGQGIAPRGPGPGREGIVPHQVWPPLGTSPSRSARGHRRRRGPLFAAARTRAPWTPTGGVPQTWRRRRT